MNFIDTHCHLYAEEFDADRESVISTAMKLGVSKIYLPNVDSSSIDRMLGLEEKYPNYFVPMMGLHPCSVNQNFEKELDLVLQWLSKKSFKAIGEIGMDLYWDKTFLREQEVALRKQIEWALKLNLPIVIHCREAFDEILKVLESFPSLPKGIFHCFSGNLEQAKRVLELGQFKLGIGGVLTFKNSGLDRVIKEISLEHLVLETDAPYLAPSPHRGKRNEPAFLLIVARRLAELKEVSMDEIAAITNKNSDCIFGA